MLTILLTLNGRVPFTLRWLTWCALNRCPYKIIVADSSSDDVVEKMIHRPECSALDIQYIRYPRDVNLRCWYRKLADATARVNTRFVMQADNDDFILFAALQESLLEAEKCGDACLYSRPHFRVQFGSPGGGLDDYLYPHKSVWVKRLHGISGSEVLRDRSAMLRLGEVVGNLAYAPFFWYGICDSGFVREVHQNVAFADYGLCMFQEWHFTFGATLRGRCVVGNGAPFVCRQDWTSTGAASMYDRERLDYIYMQPSWSADLSTMLQSLFFELRGRHGESDYEKFSALVTDGIWDMARRKTRYTYWADVIRATKWGRVFERVKARVQRRGYRRLEEYRSSADLVRFRSFLNSRSAGAG